MVKSLSILGSTGSIGKQSIAAARHLGIPVRALTAQRKVDLLEEQARLVKPEYVAVFDEKAVRDLLAWESIKTDSERLNLDAAQNAETASNISRCNDTVRSRLNEVYCWLLVPSIDSGADMKTVIWDTDKLVGMEPIVPKTAAKMIQNEQNITKWAPSLLKMELDNLLWKDDNHIQVKKLWEYLTTYCYLPRLANFSVLEATIRAGVASDESFAIASGISGERYYPS